MKLKRRLLIGIMSFCVCLLIYAPAQVMGVILSQLSNGRLGVAAPNGGIWKGEANLLLNSIDDTRSTIDLGKVYWNTDILQLLAGKFAVSLIWNNSAPIWVTLDSSRLHIEHAVFNLPSEVVSYLVPSLKVAQLGGQLALRCDNFSLSQHDIAGQLNIDWNQASSLLSTVNPLGNYNAKLEGVGKGLSIQLTTLSNGPLIIQGVGSWVTNEGLHFEGTAEAQPTSKLQLQELLRVMGNETSADSGRYQMHF